MTQHSASTTWILMRRSTWLALLCTAAASSPALPQWRTRGRCRRTVADAVRRPGTEALAEGRPCRDQLTSTWTDKDGKTYCSATTRQEIVPREPRRESAAGEELHGRKQRRVH